ncbi:MAG: helix-turn-helix transcriptional regulator [Deltaproteobacteria bacterium]|nr:helix-turn-helix transcriptional regulator [Deltaproteobacteria bacterium]
MIVDAAGVVIEGNSSGRMLLRDDGATHRVGTLRLLRASVEDQRSLLFAVERATSCDAGSSSSIMTLCGDDGHRVTFLLTPLTAHASGSTSPQVLLLALHVDRALVLLSPRQRRVAELACLGATNEEMARTLGTKSATIRSHMKEIYRRLDVSTRLELARHLGETAFYGGAARSTSSQ